MQGWESFYEVTGEGAATLTGLLFLAATLTSGRDPDRSAEGLRLFSTPTVVKFVTVVLASALALTPRPYERWSALGLLALGLFGVLYSFKTCLGLRRFPGLSHWSDPWFYGFTPPVAYAALLVAGAARVLDLPFAPAVVAVSVLALLVLAIRNAWDLVTWLAPRRDQL